MVLLSVVERFDAAVERHGGDLMWAYISRIAEATAQLRHHPQHAD